MERNIAKQVFTKDSKKRITVYYDEDGIDPMGSTDFPLHCEDWVRGYTIATGKHSSNYESSARGLLEWVLDNHADSEKAIDYLIKAGKDEKHFGLDDYLIYNRSERRWELWSDGCDELWFDKRDYIDWLAITGRLTDETIDFMVSEFLRDTIKMCEYSFCYYSGGVLVCLQGRESRRPETSLGASVDELLGRRATSEEHCQIRTHGHIRMDVVC